MIFLPTDQKKKPFTHVKENSSEHKPSPIRYTGTLFSPVYHCYGGHTLEDGENNNTVLETDDSDSTASSKYMCHKVPSNTPLSCSVVGLTKVERCCRA